MAKTKTTILENNGIELRLLIELNEKDSHKEYLKIVNEHSRGLEMPGFRPGKVPIQVVEKRYGFEHLAYALKDEIYNQVLNDGIDNFTEVPVIESLPVVLVDFHMDNMRSPFSIEVRALTCQKLNETAYKNLKLKINIPKRDKDAEIKDQMVSLIQQHLDPRYELSDEGLKEWGIVRGSYIVKSAIAGDIVEELSSREIKDYKVNDDDLPEEVFLGLIGHKAGEQVEVELQITEEDGKSPLEKTYIYSFNIDKVYDEVDLEWTDELVQKHCEGLDSVEALREHSAIIAEGEHLADIDQLCSKAYFQAVLENQEIVIDDFFLKHKIDFDSQSFTNQLLRSISNSNELLSELEFSKQIKTRMQMEILLASLIEQEMPDAFNEDEFQLFTEKHISDFKYLNFRMAGQFGNNNPVDTRLLFHNLKADYLKTKLMPKIRNEFATLEIVETEDEALLSQV